VRDNSRTRSARPIASVVLRKIGFNVVYSRTQGNRGHRFLWRRRGSGGTYSDLLQHSVDVEAFDLCFKCIDLPTLIRIKEAAGRPKDREAIAELRVLLQETEQKQS
jgi:hypothetical protein